MDGHWALWLARRPELPIAASVIFQAARNVDFTRSNSRLLFHFAGNDEWVSAASVRKLRKNLEVAGSNVSYCGYPGTHHWFFESDRPEAFRREGAASAYRRTLAFLREGSRANAAAKTDTAQSQVKVSFGFITAIDRFRAPVLLSLHEMLFCISHVYGK